MKSKDRIFIQSIIENYFKSLGWKCIESNYTNNPQKVELVFKRTDNTYRFVKYLVSNNSLGNLISDISSLDKIEIQKSVKDWINMAKIEVDCGIDFVSIQLSKLRLLYISDIIGV